MDNLSGRVAVVTGAAGGIGLAMAKSFASQGMKLVMADIEGETLARSVAALRAEGADAIGVQTDVTSEAQIKALADAEYSQYGAVHVLCNTAGVATPALRILAFPPPKPA